jgi:hypothetical protein
MAIAGCAGTIHISGTSTAFTNEPMDYIDGLNEVAQILDPAKRVLDALSATFKADLIIEEESAPGVWTDCTADVVQVNALFGVVRFSAGKAVDVRASGRYLPLLPVAQCKETTVSLARDMLDTTTFDSGCARSRMAGLASASGSVSGLFVGTEDIDPGAGTRRLLDTIQAGVPVVVESKPGAGAPTFRAFALLESTETTSSVEDLVAGTYAWQSVAVADPYPDTGGAFGGASFGFSDVLGA